jgi:hypothetical protein
VLKEVNVLGIEAHAYNPSTWEAEAERSRVHGHLGLYDKILFQEKQKELNKD